MGDQHVGPLWLYLDNHAVTGQPRQTPPRSFGLLAQVAEERHRRAAHHAVGFAVVGEHHPAGQGGCHGAPETDEAHRVFGGEHGSPAHRAAAAAVIHGHQVDRVGGAEQMAAVAGHPARRAVAGLPPALTGQVQQQRNRGHDATVAGPGHDIACARVRCLRSSAGNVAERRQRRSGWLSRAYDPAPECAGSWCSGRSDR